MALLVCWMVITPRQNVAMLRKDRSAMHVPRHTACVECLRVAPILKSDRGNLNKFPDRQTIR